MIYTTQGAMTSADLAEHRADTDWAEFHQAQPQNGECDHGRLLTDDCDECERY